MPAARRLVDPCRHLRTDRACCAPSALPSVAGASFAKPSRPAVQYGTWQRGRHGQRIPLARDPCGECLRETAELGLTRSRRRRTAAPLARRQRPGLSLGRPARGARRAPCRRRADKGAHMQEPGTAKESVFLAPDCPARGHRVNGDPTGRRTRSATPTIDPTTTHKDWRLRGRPGLEWKLAHPTGPM